MSQVGEAARIEQAKQWQPGPVRADPLAAYRFRVEIDVKRGASKKDRQIAAHCVECSGLQVDMKPVEYREGGQNAFVHQFRGQASYPPLILKRGLMASDEFWSWHQDVVNGIVVRRSGAIYLLGDDGDEAMHWDFIDAIPLKWSVGALNAGTAALAFETVELVHRGLKWMKAKST